MRVLLVQSFVTTRIDTSLVNLIEPQGLLAIATYIEREMGDAVTIDILDLYEKGQGKLTRRGETLVIGMCDGDAICAEILKFNPDVLGVTSNFSDYFDDVVDLTKIVAGRFPDLTLVLGGAHVTVDADDTLRKNPHVDFIVRREGEITFKELLAKLIEKDNDFSDILGLTYWMDGVVKSNPDRPLIRELDLLPVPDRKFINMDFYISLNRQVLPYARQHPIATIMTSRGCPYACIFCSTKNMWERRFRGRSAEKVAEEVKYLYDTYGIREFAIMDDQFIGKVKRVEEICHKINELNLGDISLSIPAGTSVWLVNEELLRLMKKTGFYRLNFPIESGNEKTVKFVKKPVNLALVKEMVRMANKIGFWTAGNFIIGFPYETQKDIRETIRYAFDCGLDLPIFLVALPFKGAEMYDIYLKENLLTETVTRTYATHSFYDTKYLKKEEINALWQEAQGSIIKNKIKFYLNPVNFYNHFWPKMKTYKDLKYLAKLFYVMFIFSPFQKFKRSRL